MQKLTNPTGTKTITITNDELAEFHLEDVAAGSRDFNLHIILESQFATAKVYGIAKSTGDDKKNWKVTISLTGKDQSGSLDLKGIADDNSSLRFDGGGIVGKNSEEGSVEIHEKIVLFSPNAKGNAVPMLRVETENVRSASHSASIAPFDEEMFFYLATRGMNQKNAKELLLDGFLTLPKA